MAKLGQLLVQANLVTENNLARALGVQNFAGGRLGTLLLERGSVDEDGLGNTLAVQHGCEYVPWRVLDSISAVTIAALPAKFAIKHGAIPYERGENYLKLALRDPGDLRILDELFFVTGRKVFAGVAPEVRIYQALEKYYGERRTPRYVILADKLTREARASRGLAAPPPPPEFFPSVGRKPSRVPGPQEVWGEGMEPELGAPTLIESWKLPDQPAGGWAGTASPGMRPEPVTDPEIISWEEMPQIPSLWVSEQPAAAPPAAAPKTVRTEPVPAPPPPAAAAESRPAEPAAPEPPETPKMPPPVPRVKAPEPVMPPPLPLPPRAAPVAPTSEISSSPPLPAPTPPAVRAEASAAQAPAKPAPRAKPPASAPALPPGVGKLIAEPTDFSEVTQSTDRDSIAAAALSALGRRFDRGAIFAARPDAVAAWGVTGNVVMENFRAIEIPWTEPSVFLNVRYSRTFYLGPLPPLPRHTAFARALGGWPAECVVYPVLMRDRPVAFLYAEFSQDRGATPMDLAYLRGLASATSSAFASAIRQKKREI
jgi:type II secretion system (T2SS) protein E